MLINEVRPVIVDLQSLGLQALSLPSYFQKFDKHSMFTFSNLSESGYIGTRALTVKSLVKYSETKATNFELKLAITMRKLSDYDWECPYTVSFTDFSDVYGKFEDYLAGRDNIVSRLTQAGRVRFPTSVFVSNSLLGRSVLNSDSNRCRLLFCNVAKVENAAAIRRSYTFNGPIKWEHLTEYWISESLMKPEMYTSEHKLSKVFKKIILPELREAGYRIEIVPQEVMDSLHYDVPKDTSFSLRRMKEEASSIANMAREVILIETKEGMREFSVSEAELDIDYLSLYRSELKELVELQSEAFEYAPSADDIAEMTPEQEIGEIPQEVVHQGILGQIANLEGPTTMAPLTVESLRQIMEDLSAPETPRPVVDPPYEVIPPRPLNRPDQFNAYVQQAAQYFEASHLIQERPERAEALRLRMQRARDLMPRSDDEEAAIRRELMAMYPLMPSEALDVDTGTNIHPREEHLIHTSEDRVATQTFTISELDYEHVDQYVEDQRQDLYRNAGIPVDMRDQFPIEMEQYPNQHGGAVVHMRVRVPMLRGINTDAMNLEDELAEARMRESLLNNNSDGNIDNDSPVS